MLSDNLSFYVGVHSVLAIGSETVSNHEQVDIPVTFVSGSAQIVKVSFTLVIDPQVVEVVSIAEGEQALAAGKRVDFSVVDDARIDIVVDGNTNVLADGKIVVITFAAAAESRDGQCSQLLCHDTESYSPAGASVVTISNDGQCCVELEFDPADVNRDFAVDAVDIQFVINEALGLDSGRNCDANADGTVDAVDIQLVINAVLGIGISLSL